MTVGKLAPRGLELTRVWCGLGDLLDHGVVLIDAALDEVGLYFRFLSCQQVNFGLESPITRQLNLDAMLSRRDLHRMKLAAKFAHVAYVPVIEKHGGSIWLYGQLQCRGRRW